MPVTNGFVFKLESLYEYRQRLEEGCTREFTATLEQLNIEEQKLADLHAAYVKGCDDFDRLKEKGGQAQELGMYGAYFNGLKERIAGQKKVVEAAKERFELCRAKLVEATKEKKVVETLKKNAYEAYLKKLDKLEQKENDDLVSGRFKRSR